VKKSEKPELPKQPGSDSRFSLHSWIHDHRRLLCAVVAALLYLSGLGQAPLWEPDEGRYAEIAREMLLTRDYITPRNNYVRYFEKPPLVYWATAASLRIFGRNEFGVRLQAAIASVGQVAVTEALGERMFGVAAGVLAALVLGLSPLFFGFARFATPDPALAFFLTAAMACFYAGARRPQLGGVAERRWMLAATAMLALGTLTKGPVALLLGGAIGLGWLVLEGRARDAVRLPWLGCGAIYAAIALPWFIAVAQRNQGFLRFFFIHEHLQRYLADTEHGWGPWFFVPVVIAGTWPWAYFIPLGLSEYAAPLQRLALHRGRASPAAQPEPARETGPRRTALDFLLIWFGIVFFFFSIPRSKLGGYILPALPPLAILAACGLTRMREIPVARRQARLALFTAINAAAAASIGFAACAAVGRGLTPSLASDGVVVGAALLIGSIVALLLGRTHSSIAVVTGPLALSVVVMMAAGIDARQNVAAGMSYRRLAAIVAPYTSRGCRLASFAHFEQSLPFYTGVRETLVNYRGELEPFGPVRDPRGDVFATAAQLQEIWAREPCTVLIANHPELSMLAHLLSPPPTLLGCEGKKVALCNCRLKLPGRSASARGIAQKNGPQ